MARRTLSTQGRVVAAGLSIAVGGALVGLMAVNDHTADATPTSTTVGPASGGGATSATPSDRESLPTPGDLGSGSTSAPQPQTRTGGS
jgi:hypothetical protein